MKQRGFSLIELLIVVTVILVIAAIAIPNMLRARISANEASAVASIRAVTTAQVTYATMYPTSGYADDLAKLGGVGGGVVGPNHADLLDWVLGCAAQPCSRSGYQFFIRNVTGTPPSDYEVVGIPERVGVSGLRGFCSNQRNPIMVDPSGGSVCTVLLQ